MRCRAWSGWCPTQMAFATVGDTRVMLLGIEQGSHPDIYTSMAPRDRSQLLAGEGVALSRDLGRAIGVGAGDMITLNTPTGGHRVQVLELVPYFSGMTGTIAMSLGAMQGWFQRPGASDLEITAAGGADPTEVQARIRDALPQSVFVYSGRDALEGVSSALDQVIAVISIIAWIVVVVSAVTLLNTLMLSVLDGRREIGVLRAIGATRLFTLKAVLAEAAGVGAVGGVLGLVLGTAIEYLTSVEPSRVLCALPFLGRMARCRASTTRPSRPRRSGWSVSTPRTTTRSGPRCGRSRAGWG